MYDTENRNAVIKKAYFDTERGLSAWLQLDYGGTGQGFGGYVLYLSKDSKHHIGQSNAAGHFIYRCLKVAGVSDWAKLPGRTVRVKCSHNGVLAIGHIIKDDWFNPQEEFEQMIQENIDKRG